MKRRALPINILCNLMLQFTTIVSGLILPRLIISTYGSATNGLIASITQFLSYIVLLESGIGGVIKAELYKPLMNNNREQLGGIIRATNSFFSKIGYAFMVYLLFLMCTFNRIAHTEFDWIYTASLVLILGISTLEQYFFGITYQTVLQADQKYWLTSGVQIITIWLNVILSVVFILQGYSIHLVKLITALVYTVRPIVFNLYVHKKYDINWHAKPDQQALAQRWDGFGHHIAYFIHSNTDIALLTIFVNVAEVSVYSVYMLVVNGIRSLMGAVSSAIEPYFGKIIASEDKELLKKRFGLYEILNFYGTTIVFTAAAFLIVPFVKLYTSGVADAAYIRPVFACILVAAEAFYCLRNPYSCVIFAAGHFKQTKMGAFVEAGINIVLSLILIKPFGIVGVALGTLAAMLYRTTEYVVYLTRHIVHLSIAGYVKKILASVFTVALTALWHYYFAWEICTALDWIVQAVCVTSVVIVVATICFGAFFPRACVEMFQYLRNRR